MLAFRDWKVRLACSFGMVHAAHPARRGGYCFQVYAAGVMFFGANCALSGLQGFLPTIIASFGFSKQIFSLDSESFVVFTRIPLQPMQWLRYSRFHHMQSPS